MSAYLDFYRNEIAIDYFWRDRLGIPKGGVNYRPLKYSFFNKSRVCFFLFCMFWPAILSALNFFYFCKAVLASHIGIDELSGRSVWIESSLKSEQLRNFSKCADLKVVDIRKSEYFSYLSRLERVKIFRDSIFFILFRVKDVGVSDRLQFIDCYRLFCFFKFISNINFVIDELHICNHYDRWAMACFEGFPKGVNVWQHGILDESLDLPVKLKNIRCIHGFSLKEAGLWRNYLADVGVDIVVQETSFMLSLGVEKVDVLIISHPAYTADEVSLLMFLSSNEAGLSVAYKPHPAYDYSKVLAGIQAAGVEVVPASEYPSAALAITKGSTLGHEYETAGVSVVWWGGESISALADLIKIKLSDKI